MSNYMPIEGRTMVLEADDSNAGYSGDSLDYGGGQSGDWRVYWYWDPATSRGGITNISWPSDFDTYSGALSIYSLLEQLEEGSITTEVINEAVYTYARYHLFYGGWDNFRDTYNANAVDCVRPAK